MNNRISILEEYSRILAQELNEIRKTNEELNKEK